MIPNYQRAPVKFVRGQGSTLVDSDDNKYLDCLSGIAVCGLGHAHPELAHVLSEASQKSLAYLESLSGRTPGKLGKFVV